MGRISFNRIMTSATRPRNQHPNLNPDLREQVMPLGRVVRRRYEATVTREGPDLYSVGGTSLFLKTRYCYKSVLSG